VHSEAPKDIQATPRVASPLTGHELKRAIAEVPFWWHSIDLGEISTPGGKNAELLQKEWETMKVPNLEGKTVLDIGAWDGYFTFMAEPDSP
jgi:tRNA (mo5U34)-methyltransferase